MKRLALWAALLAGVLAGCGGAFPREVVPSDPIAFVRLEPAKGLASFEDFRGAVRIPNPEDPASLEARRETTVTLLHVPTLKLTPLPEAGEGTLPLDWSHDGSRLLVGRIHRGQGSLQLQVWNRLTGAYTDASIPGSAGPASLGAGPVRLAIQRVLRGSDGAPVRSVGIYLDGAGAIEMPGSNGGRMPDIAPDGRTVVYVGPDRGASTEPILFSVVLGSGEPRPIGRGLHPRFSRDGRYIAYVRERRGNSDIWVMRSNGSGKRAVASTSFDEEYPALSPDGRFVVYGTQREIDAESHLFLTRIEDRAEIQITRLGQSTRPVW